MHPLGIDQRMYSPVDGSLAFPALMVRVGAAHSITNGGGLPSYQWKSSAPNVLRSIGRAVGEHSPTPHMA
jgi:hypothetical protein